MENHYTSNLAVDLGRIEYRKCLDLQLSLVSLRREGKIPDTMLMLEHDPPVYTIGRKSDPLNFQGVDVVRTDRGGDVTYHSPGQLVIYLIFDLRSEGRVDVRAFVKSVENIIIEMIEKKGHRATVGEEPGIWIETGKKVASLGMAIDNGISYHGVALNISEEPLKGFSLVNPCGLDPNVMGFVDFDRKEAMENAVRIFSERFGKFEPIDCGQFLTDVSAISGKKIPIE
jgi:lipoyl(octanoyl) transferase